MRTTDPATPSYTKIFVDGTANWVKLKPGMEKAAAFLETHRYADLMGGSMGFTKMEGTTVNVKDKIAYSALQNIQASMVKTATAGTPIERHRARQALHAGGVLAHNLTGGQKDTGGAAIASEWVPVADQDAARRRGHRRADALGNLRQSGQDRQPGQPEVLGEAAHPVHRRGQRHTTSTTSCGPTTSTPKTLSRILSLPAGAESTGLQAVDDINGFTYIMSNFQHPGDWSAPARQGASRRSIRWCAPTTRTALALRSVT